MKRARFTEKKIIDILREIEGGAKAALSSGRTIVRLAQKGD
jgi:hypothetical protein